MSDSGISTASSREALLARALDRLRAIQDEIMRGVAHAMSNRVASLSAGLFVLGEHGTATAASIGTMQSELDRMEELLTQLRMLPREDVPAEPLLARDSAHTAARLHEHHGELRNVSCDVEDDGSVPPAHAEPQALLHALLVAITTAKQSAGAGKARLILAGDHDVVRFIATSDVVGASTTRDDSAYAIEASAADWLVSRSGGHAYATSTGCVIEVPTLAARRRSR